MGLVVEQGRFVVSGSLLNAVASTSDGTWVRTHGIHPFSVTVSIATTATVKIRVSNATAPADSDNTQPQLGSDLTASGSVLSDGPYRWVKAQVSAWSAGAVSADLLGAAEGHAR